LGSTPSDTDKVATVFNTFLKAIATGGAQAGEVYVKSLDPALLTLPIISQLLDFGISEISNAIYGFIARSVTGLIIDIQTNGENSKVMSAGTALQLANASGNAQAIQLATTNMVQAWANEVFWDGQADI
jgi:hypothetical protein